MRATNHRPYQGYPYVNPPVHEALCIDTASASRRPYQGSSYVNSPVSDAPSIGSAAISHRPYQGYPYVNPPINDATTIDSATVARWRNLPRKQVELPVQRTDPVVYISMPDRQKDTEARHETVMGRDRLPKKPDPEPSPVVYIDMPEGSGSHVSTGRRESSDSDEEPQSSTYRQDLKRDPADDPVVYIDLPEGNGSDVAQSPQNEEPEYVQETIFYNPFENRRMEMNKDESRRRDSESEDDVSSISEHSNRRRPLPPIRPSRLDLYGAGSSGVSSSNLSSSSTPGLPAIMSKETMMYMGSDDRFPMSPIPVSEFPEPPPSYAEIDRVSSPVVEPQEPVVEQPRREEPPRTQVILPRDQTPITPMGLPNSERKYLNCHHCGMRVHSLVIRENGTITHVTAFICLLICVLPIVACIYCTDYLKIKNHYCPSCNKIIGYELPLTSDKIVYVN